MYSSKEMSCYCLQNETGKTYIGFTVDVDRRLRQHNREISGGARATSGSTSWKRTCFVHGFPTHRDALQFEWKWKNISRKCTGKTPLQRRLEALQQLVSLEQSTSKATPFSQFPAPLQIFAEIQDVWNWFQDKEMGYAILVDHRPNESF